MTTTTAQKTGQLPEGKPRSKMPAIIRNVPPDPVGKVPAKVLKALRQALVEKRELVADNWVRFMLDNDWLVLHIALPKLTLVAYPNTPNKFVREIDLTEWLNPKLLATLAPDIIELNREMAALRLWTNRPEEQAYDVRLSRLLWTE